MVYATTSPDFAAHLKLKERLNLAFLRLVAARGLAFAHPTQTIQLEGGAAPAPAKPRA